MRPTPACRANTADVPSDMTPMNITWGAMTLGSGVSRATSVFSGTLRFLPKRTETEYVVHDCTLAGFVACVVGDVEAIVEVGAGGAAVPPLVSGEPAEDALGDDEPLAGDGDTIDTGVLELDDEAVADPDEEALDALDDDDAADDFAGAGFELSLWTPLAKGLRAMRARTTLTGTLDGACVVAVWVEVVAAAGGAGGNGVPSADAPLSSSTGTASRARTRTATTGQSLRSSRSRRSELIPVLPWWCRTCPWWPPTDRSMR